MSAKHYGGSFVCVLLYVSVAHGWTPARKQAAADLAGRLYACEFPLEPPGRPPPGSQALQVLGLLRGKFGTNITTETVVPADGLRNLVGDSAAVIEGTVISCVAFISADGSTILEGVTVRRERLLKGAVDDEPVIIIPGGTIKFDDGSSLQSRYQGMRDVKVNDKWILFLSPAISAQVSSAVVAHLPNSRKWTLTGPLGSAGFRVEADGSLRAMLQLEGPPDRRRDMSLAGH
jgi:hypothetical protein